MIPAVDYAICWEAGPSQTPVQPRWTSMRARTKGAVTVKRGRQYELDQVQPGELDVTFDNLDGALDPTNTTGRFAGAVVPNRLFRMRMQYPASANLLTPAQAAGGSLTVPASSSNAILQTLTGWSYNPLQPLSVTVTAATPTSGVNLFVQVRLYDVTGTLLPGFYASSAAAAAVGGTVYTVNLAANLNARAASADIVIVAASSPASAATVTTSNVQAAVGASIAYQTPGTWYPVFTGYVERWPQSWLNNGIQGEVSTVAVDAFSYFSGQLLRPSYMADLIAAGAGSTFSLDEPQGSPLFFDRINPSAQPFSITNSPSGAGTVAAGSSLPSPASTGSPNRLNFTNTYLGGYPACVTVGATNYAASFLQRTVGLTPAGGANGFTKLIAFRVVPQTSGPTQMVWAAPYSELFLSSYSNTGGATPVYSNFLLMWNGTFGAAQSFPANAAAAADGNWHLALISITSDLTTVHLALDGQVGFDGTPATGNVTGSGVPTSQLFIVNGNYTGALSPSVYQESLGGYGVVAGMMGTNGSFAMLAEFPFGMTTTDARWARLYESWRYAWAGQVDQDQPAATAINSESSGTRYSRLLSWGGWAGPTAVDRGTSVRYGPAVELASEPTSAPNLLATLQTDVDTENGVHWIGKDGTPIFDQRVDRYVLQNPAVTFGENIAAGELPYLSAAFDFDTSHVINDAQVTEEFAGTTMYAADATSKATLGQRSVSRTVNTIVDLEAQDAAAFLVMEERNARPRIQTLSVDVSALDPGVFPNAWTALLGLDIGSRVRVNRRPPSPATTITFDGFVEAISWKIDGNTGHAVFSCEISPLLPFTAALASTTQLTLASPSAVGATTLTVNALSDAATNRPLGNFGSFPFGVALEPYGANGEAVTCTAMTNPAPGYSTFQLTVTPTSRAHAAGSVLSDYYGGNPLTTYDANAVADTAVAAY